MATEIRECENAAKWKSGSLDKLAGFHWASRHLQQKVGLMVRFTSRLAAPQTALLEKMACDNQATSSSINAHAV